MARHKLYFLLLFACLNTVNGQTRIAGFVKEKSTEEVLVGAFISESESDNVSVSDNQGFFSIIINVPGTLKVSFVGFSPVSIIISSSHDSLIKVLMEGCTELDEVVVKAQRKPLFSANTLSYIEMMQTPSLGSKPDVLKTLQLQPGIQSQNEGSSLLQVRGGNPGENLYLLDNAPLIYVNHLGGFMSVFNPDIINNVIVYKGGFPAKFGGKLSSVVDITQREGNNSEIKGSCSVGITDISLILEGPLKIKNTTFILTGRKTFTDLLLAAVSKLAEGDYIVSYGFHDINGKFSWKPDEKNSLHLNIYQGDDYLNYWWKDESYGSSEKSHIGNTWGNWMLSADWNHVISPRLYTSTSLSYTNYRLKYLNFYSTTGKTEEYDLKIKYLSAVRALTFKSGWSLRLLKNWILNYGLQSSFYTHIPNNTYRSDTVPSSDNQVSSLESGIYLENRISLPGNSEVSLGLRAVPYFANDYFDFSLEPRLNLTIGISANHELNFSYAKVNQYSHLIFNTGTFLNNEVWIPADETIPPTWSQQVTGGWNGYFRKQMLQAGVELFYKDLRSLATYREGYTNLMGDVNWRDKIETNGTGKAYGIELFFKKNYGKCTGFINYSYSKATRQYANINGGMEYIFEYDRPNSGSIGISYNFSDNLALNLVWVYQTGLPYTPAIGLQYTPDLDKVVDGLPFYYEALIYGQRNSERMKDYHRLDIALQYTRLTTKRKLKSIWSFSVYNLYSRHNPYYYYYNTNNSGEMYYPYPGYENETLKLYQISFFPIMPTLSYKVYFDKSH